MNKVPIISIVTPSYNQAKFIAETIESVISQEGNFEIEYFIMDGGSTDESVDIIKKYADQLKSGNWRKKCSNISMKWVSQKDKGQSDAINQGFRLATGDVVSWINSDDVYVPGAFACVLEGFFRHPEADFIYGDGDVINEKGELQWEWLSRPYNLRLLMSYHFLWNEFTNYIMQQATFWRRLVFDRIGYLNESFHYGMDIEYWIRAGVKDLRLCHIPQKLGQFRFIAGTKSLSSPTIFWEDHIEIVRKYRGSTHLAKYFAYYYFNLAKEYDFDLSNLEKLKNDILKRWHELPREEYQLIQYKASLGYKLGCFLAANELYKNGRFEQASHFFKTGLSDNISVIFHPIAWPYIIRNLVGLKFTNNIDLYWQKLLKAYRQRRYDYRYFKNN